MKVYCKKNSYITNSNILLYTEDNHYDAEFISNEDNYGDGYYIEDNLGHHRFCVIKYFNDHFEPIQERRKRIVNTLIYLLDA